MIIMILAPKDGLQHSCVSQAPTYCIKPKGFDMSVWKKGVPKMNSERSCAVYNTSKLMYSIYMTKDMKANRLT